MSCKKVEISFHTKYVYSETEKSVIIVKFNKKNGECRVYHKNGNIKETCYYSNNKKNGMNNYYTEYQYIRNKCYYINNMRNGENINYHTYDQEKIFSKYYLIGDVRNRYYIEYDS